MSTTFQVGKNIIGIGRDFKGTIINNNPQELFYKINVNGFSKDYIPPKISGKLLSEVRNNRLIVIGGDYGFDKGSLLRYMAEQLNSNINLDVLEWAGISERQSIFSSLENLQPSIIILQKLQPYHINYDLQELKKISQRKQLYFLISTDTPHNAWQLSPNFQQQYWLNLDSKNIQYDEKLILDELVNLMNKDITKMNFQNGINKVDINSQLPGGDIKQLSKNLSNPQQVQFFVKSLVNYNKPIDLSAIKECLKQTLDKQDTLLNKWFHSLDNLEQYIVLSMVLFIDLFDDQYFSVAKILSESQWKHSHDGLKALDYKDIEKLFNFFKYDIVNREQRYIRNKFPNQRLDLLISSWYSHRRHIKMALDAGVELVIKSKESHLNTELYGSKKKRNAIRLTVMNLLSDLGRISRGLIEEPLLILASQDSLSSQNVAAGAIANWREIPGGDKQLFELLSDWQESSQWQLIIDEIIKGREKAASPAAYLRSTIILTIGKAANYDAPNQLSHELIELLIPFLTDTNELVRDRLINTIPDIIRNHALQFSKSIQLTSERIILLETLLKHEDLIYSVSVGLALAHLDSPKSTSKIITSCLKYCENNADKSGKKKLTYRDKLMVAMILTLGKIIEWTGIKTQIDKESIYDILQSLRAIEKNTIIKSLLLYMFIEQILLDNKKWQLINIVLPKLTANERDLIVYSFGQHYLEARKEQTGGDRTIEIEEVIYDTWVYKDRPFLSIEKLMFDWLKEDSKQLKQLATLIFIEFSALIELEEDIFQRKVIESDQQKSFQEKDDEVVTTFRPALIKGKFSIIIFLYKLFVNITLSKEATKILNAALPIVSRYYLFSRNQKKVAIKKWKRMGGDIENAAKSLSKLIR